MNKKGITPALIGAPMIILIIFILVFILSIVSGFKVFNILKDIPQIVWWGLALLILWKIFGGNK